MRHLAVPLPLSPSPGAQNPRLGGGVGLRARQRTPGAPGASKKPPRRAKRAPRGPQDAPRGPRVAERSLEDAQDGLQTAQEASKTPQDASRDGPKMQKSLIFNWFLIFFFWHSRLFDCPARRRPKKPPRLPGGGPRAPQDPRPKTVQEAPKTQDHPREPQNGPKRGPRGGPRIETSSFPPQEAPRRP